MLLQPRALHVPNSYTILSQPPQNASYFSVFDLANAFFLSTRTASFGLLSISTTTATHSPHSVKVIVRALPFTIRY